MEIMRCWVCSRCSIISSWSILFSFSLSRISNMDFECVNGSTQNDEKSCYQCWHWTKLDAFEYHQSGSHPSIANYRAVVPFLFCCFLCSMWRMHFVLLQINLVQMTFIESGKPRPINIMCEIAFGSTNERKEVKKKKLGQN